MKDIQLDFNNKKIINNLIDKKDRVSQQIRIAVNVWIGDWFLNEDFGVDYDNSWGNILLMETYIKDQIRQVSGISSIKSFKIEKLLGSDEKIQFKIDAILIYKNDIITISEMI